MGLQILLLIVPLDFIGLLKKLRLKFRPLKKKVGDRPRPPHEKGPAPKKIIFFI
jgi:hypothetical protein